MRDPPSVADVAEAARVVEAGRVPPAVHVLRPVRVPRGVLPHGQVQVRAPQRRQIDLPPAQDLARVQAGPELAQQVLGPAICRTKGAAYWAPTVDSGAAEQKRVHCRHRGLDPSSVAAEDPAP
jgi:hypothetical protein